MREPEALDTHFPALEQAQHLSEFLSEGESDEFTLSPEEAEAAHKLQKDLIHRLRTLHHIHWPSPDTTPRTSADQPDLSNLLLGTTAP